MAVTDSLLSEEQCRLCDGIIQRSTIAVDVLEKCLKCGLPAEDVLQKIRSQLETAKAFKREFAPYLP